MSVNSKKSGNAKIKAVLDRIQKFGTIHDEEKEMLTDIFTEVQDDPSWKDESTMFDKYNNRISIQEIFSLLTSDANWSNIANKG